MLKNKIFIFDLDNTLYDESIYIYKVLEIFSRKYSLPLKDYQYIKDIICNIRISRGNILKDLLITLDVYSEEKYDVLFDLYKKANVKISLYDDSRKFILQLKRKGYLLGIITNGIVDVQKNKIRLLKLEKYIDQIVYARIFGKDFEKPHEKPFKEIIKLFNKKNGKEFVYIGDDILTDFEGAKKLKMHTIRILRGPFINEPSNNFVDMSIKNFEELFQWI